MEGVFRQRKFFLACFFTLASTVALFIGKLTGGEYVTIAGVILGLYGAANVAARRIDAEGATNG